MRLYDEIIAETKWLLEGFSGRDLPVGADAPPEALNWPDGGKAQMILRSDMAYELGAGALPAVGNTLLTADASLVPEDCITIYGEDLGEITADRAYARIALVRVAEDAMGSGEQLYESVKNIGYFRYHIFPEGFMLRVSAANDRESVRISRDALTRGLDFTAIGNRMIRQLHLFREVEAVHLIFFTDPTIPYEKLADGLRRTKQITGAIDHMLKDVNMDCDACGLQEVCDEVEGLREVHFGIAAE